MKINLKMNLSLFISYSYFLLCKNGLLISFYAKTTYSYTYYKLTMTGVLECMSRSKRYLVKPGLLLDRTNSNFIELQMAKEILAEVFHARSSDVEDMIQRRLDEKSLSLEESRLDERELWPEMFWVKG